MIYAIVIDDFTISGLSRHKVREHVDRVVGMRKSNTEHAKQQPGETRAERYARLAAEDTMERLT